MSTPLAFLPESQAHVKRMMEVTKLQLPLANSWRELLPEKPQITVFHRITPIEYLQNMKKK